MPNLLVITSVRGAARCIGPDRTRAAEPVRPRRKGKKLMMERNWARTSIVTTGLPEGYGALELIEGEFIPVKISGTPQEPRLELLSTVHNGYSYEVVIYTTREILLEVINEHMRWHGEGTE
jgi:hypothetical protein